MDRVKRKKFTGTKKKLQKSAPSPNRGSYEKLKKHLIKSRDLAGKDFLEKHQKTISWLKTRGVDLVNLSEKGLRFGASALLFTALATGYGFASMIPSKKESKPITTTLDDPKAFSYRTSLVARLSQYFKSATEKPNEKTKEEIAKELSSSFELPIVSEIDGYILPDYHGLTGYEQHLFRYPGDAAFNHVETAIEWEKYGVEGIAPATGAWGYFAPSKEVLTDDLVQKEKWYAVCQTFLIPGWNENLAKYAEWYKYRKVIMVNVKTGQTVVCALGDSGPATWTGKVFGASPEAMWALGLGEGSRKGEVLMYFVNDPKDKVPLGPILPKELETITRA